MIVIRKENNKGQSIVELIFVVAIVGLVVTGIVVLVASAIGVKNRSFGAKKAMEVAELVMEDLVDEKKNNSSEFWDLKARLGETLPSFTDYFYDVGYSGVDCNGEECVIAVVKVSWGNDQSVEINKFFARGVNY